MKKIELKNELEMFKDNPIIILYIFGNSLNALLLRLFTTGRFGIRALFFDFSFVLLLAALSFLIKKKNRMRYYYLTTFLMVAICIINVMYYNYYSSFASASLLATSVFVKDVGDAVTTFAIRATDWIYLWIFVALFFIKKKYNADFKVNKRL